MKIDNELDYWINIDNLNEARTKILTNGNWQEQTEKDIKKIQDILKINSNDDVIDFGCGIGRLTKPMSKICRVIYGIDISDATLRYTIKELEGLTNVILTPMLSDIEIPVKRPIANKLYSLMVMQHIERHKVFALLKEINACLFDGGEVLIQFPSLDNLKDYKNYLMNKCGVSITTPLLCFYSKQELKFFFEENGFEILNYNETEKDYFIHAKKIKESDWFMPNGIIPKWRAPNE